MIQVKFDKKVFDKTMNNTLEYSYGFIDGIQKNRLVFNKKLSDVAAEALKKYIDTKARMSPDSLHHVYEWNMVGDPSGRLFEIDCQPTPTTISLVGKFLPSSSVSDTSDEPFVDKARVMENAIAIEIEPIMNNVLAFESEGESVFTVNSIYIANPGGDEVAGSFGRVVEDFFDFYFSTTLLQQSGLLKDLETADEYTKRFASGAKGGGRSVGSLAGKEYMDIDEVTIL